MASIKDVEQSVAQHDNEVTVTIRDAQGEPYRGLDGEPSTITVVGSESERIRRWEDERRERLRKGIEDAESDYQLEIVVAAVTRWSGWDDGTQELPCTPENVRALLGARKARSILRQVHVAINNHADFFGAASTS